MRRQLVVVGSIFLTLALPVRAQTNPAARGTVVIVTPREAMSPIPTLFGGDGANREVSDLLFLRLADLPNDLGTTDEKRFVPRLARSWHRLDPTTIVFDLDPRALWHDGKPVTAGDVIFAIERAKLEQLDGQLAGLVRRIKSVTAKGDHQVIFSFTQPYAEQLYDAVYHAPPLPAHLLKDIPADSLGRSGFAAQPVGNGPYRWKRREPGQLIELVANDGFFLGKPGPARVVILTASDAEARVNLLLGGEADAVDNIYQFANPDRLASNPRFRLYPLPSLNVGYLLFNQRDPADTTRPHPILSDPVVRRALTLGLDRRLIVRSTLGPSSLVPPGPVSAVLATRLEAPVAGASDTAEARRLLATRGWLDHDGDGTLDKDGRPLRLLTILPATSGIRRRMAAQAQEQFRQLGVDLDVQPLEPSLYTPNRRTGQFDMDLATVAQDPTPSGLAQSWSCAGIGGTNVAHYCNPRVDSLLAQASRSQTKARDLWRQAVVTIAGDAPAIFLFAPVFLYAVDARFERVTLRPESPWSQVWQWRLRAGQASPRDTE
jgi:peptide/nickel transport system substrate-binding protein